MTDEPEVQSFRIDFREQIAEAIDADPDDLEIIRSSLSDDGESASVHVIEQEGGVWSTDSLEESREVLRKFREELK